MLKHQKVFQGKETLRENNRKSRVVPNQKKIQKYINYVTHPLSSSNLSIFSPLISNFVISRNTEVDCILIHTS